MITGIGCVSELIGIAGGEDIFPERAAEPGARERIIENPEDVIQRQPDVIIGSLRAEIPAGAGGRAAWVG